jgi:hypothetical protein
LTTDQLSGQLFATLAMFFFNCFCAHLSNLFGKLMDFVRLTYCQTPDLPGYTGLSPKFKNLVRLIPFFVKIIQRPQLLFFLLCLWVHWSTTKNFRIIPQLLHGLNLRFDLQWDLQREKRQKHITGFVLIMTWFVLNITSVVLNMTIFVLNIAGFFLKMTRFVLNRTWYLY